MCVCVREREIERVQIQIYLILVYFDMHIQLNCYVQLISSVLISFENNHFSGKPSI